jgi:adenosylmethionine-8-amino-7-oxononanoate aminotransferase
MTDSTVESPLFYQTKSYTPTVAKADGIYIWDTTGKKYIDGSSGAVICNIGHNDPSILKAITTQAQSTFFSYRTQFENEPAIDLANTLVAHSADHLEKIFYVSGGSEAVESALKLCRSYYYSRGEANRFMFISRSPSYHGSTMGALSLTSYTPLEQQYRPLLQSFPKIPAPYCYRCHYKQCYPHCGVVCAHELENTLLKIGPENVAGFVTEPIGGASTGAIVPPPAYFSIIRKICDKYGIMLIFDEVMTGFGRTGKLFAYEHWNVKADIVALSKGMASGYYPLGAIMTRNDIVQSVMTYGGFPHGHTYAGNPMACAVGLAVFKPALDQGKDFFVGIDLILQQPEPGTGLGELVPGAHHFRGQRNRSRAIGFTARFSPQSRGIGFRPDTTPQIHLVFSRQPQAQHLIAGAGCSPAGLCLGKSVNPGEKGCGLAFSQGPCLLKPLPCGL